MAELLKSFSSLQSVSIGSVSLGAILSAVIIFIVCIIVMKIVGKISAAAMDKMSFDKSLKNIIQTVIKIVVWALTIVIVAETLGIPSASLIAAISVAGLALSLSIQNIMTNVFSGITVLASHPFSIGNYVDIGGTAGTVSKIGLFYTTVQTPDNKLIYIPNSDVVSGKIQNYSAEDNRRVDLNFTASYDCSTELVKRSLLEAAEADSRIFSDPAPFTAILSYQSSAIEYVLRVWCTGADYWDVYFALNERVRDVFDKNGVIMTYDHMNVHVIKE